MQYYVLGFAFTPSLNKVILMQKTKPIDQLGYLNGVGGKIEPGETPLHAMIRKFKEETGLSRKKWEYFATLTGDGFKVYCFRTITVLKHAKDMTEEKLVRLRTRDLQNPKHKLMHNLQWLIPMAMYDKPLEPVEFWTGNLPNNYKFSKSK